MNFVPQITLFDKKPLSRYGLAALLQSRMPDFKIESTGDHNDLSKHVQLKETQLILINAGPASSPISVVKTVRSLNPSQKILMIIPYAEPSLIINAIKFGTSAILTGDSDIEELIDAIRSTVFNGCYFNPVIQNTYDLSKATPVEKAQFEFTDAEARIITLVAKGLNTREIATCIGMTFDTVNTYRKRVLQKTKSKNTAQLIAVLHRTSIL